ncbi:MAG TPA: hypothetical protein VJX68_06275 [Candidatus Binatus sp.]|nr:hypothetical protein [Candidatus Binatus sp.]HKN12787.1 hypothetical protein [Candidatus Binatus sp.]
MRFKAPAQLIYFIEGAGNGDRHGHRIGKNSQPPESCVIYGGAAEYAEDALQLSTEGQRISGEALQSFQPRQVRGCDPLVVVLQGLY